MIRRLRLGNLRNLLRDRNGPILPDDDAGREYLMELLLPISVGPHAAIKMRNAIEVWAPWMQQKEAAAIIDQINLMPIWQRKPTAEVLGERLRVTNGDRERLKLWTIAPSDMGKRGMAWWRKLKDRERKLRLRQLRGRKSRAQYECGSINRTKPWLALQISRATWYRQRETSPSEVRLNNAVDTLVSPQKRLVSKKESAEKKRTASSVKPTLQSEKPERLVDTAGTVTALEINGHTCLTIVRAAFGIGHNAGPALDERDLRGMPQDMSRYYRLITPKRSASESGSNSPLRVDAVIE